jgi:hypothetical protein
VVEDREIGSWFGAPLRLPDGRCARYGHGASVLTVRRRPGPRREGAPELDMLDVAARTRQLRRLTDVVAAVGPREVAVLLAETRPEGARQAAARILAGLGDHARDLAFGLAHRERTGLVGAWSASRLAAAGGPGGVVRELDGPSPAADRASAAHVPRAVVATPC